MPYNQEAEKALNDAYQLSTSDNEAIILALRGICFALLEIASTVDSHIG